MTETTHASVVMPTEAPDGITHLIADGYRVASRVIFPVDGDLDVMPLYVEMSSESKEESLHPDDLVGRFGIRVRPGTRVSLGAYFNAFPASYWRRWTTAKTVRLVANTTGEGQLLIYKSNARGNKQRVTTRRVVGDGAQSVVDLDLNTFGDGGWYWFDLVAGSQALSLDSAQWWVPAGDSKPGSATFATTTLNKADYIVSNMTAVSGDRDLLGCVDEILIIDQGSKKVVDHPGYPAIQSALGDKLVIIEQANLGGSGGFSRGMYETVQRGKSDYVILLDDDIALEPESIVRLVTFADMCRKPTLVGGHMFDLLNRTVLHTFGEIVDPYRWQPALPGPDQELGHDFAEEGSLLETRWMHQRVDVDYNGWWMDLIPVSVIKEIGLSLPVFIKWDDAEYGLRAKEAGYATVSLPGAAVWHVSWVDKDDLVGWQAYFHDRNRYITALLHSRYPRGGDILRNSQFLDVKHLVSMQYYTVAGRLRAQRDLLAGPDGLHSLEPTALPEIRATEPQYSDSTFKSEYDAYPAIHEPKPKRPRKSQEMSKPALMLSGVKAVGRQFAPKRPGADDNPQTSIAFKDNKWWNTAQWDSALVTNAEGTGIAWYVRRPELMRQMLAESVKNQAKIATEWPRLRTMYREALPRITSFDAWEETFGIPPAES